MQETPLGGADQTEPAIERPRRRRFATLKIVGAGVAVLLVALGGGGYFYYRHLDANLSAAPLYAGTDPAPTATTYTDPYGRHALNILVIGSDSRESAEDCALGHACNSIATNIVHADVELLVHVSADRSNATAMSIPRDTMTNLPGCKDTREAKHPQTVAARYGQINSTLEYGPGCTVAAVEKLTGVHIDHFVEADFSGVIKMSDAIGGAQVCVSGDVYDPLSHLKLSKGQHVITGLGALEFVRTRHAFGDGSDLGRTQSQHLFLSAVIRKMKSHGTLFNPVKVLALANTATQALTVDDDLASVSRLVGLANTIRSVPADRITFVTMPNQQDPADHNRVVVAPEAQRIFDAMIKDKALTAGDASIGATPSPSTSGTPEPSASPATSKKTQEALDAGHASTASDDKACAEVSTQPIVEYNGRFMTPAQAYADSTGIPKSAP